MATITKTRIRDYVRTKLGTDPCWAKAALLKIFEFQTAEEQSFERTHEHNGIGFTGVDGEILASFAKQFRSKGYLSPKQMNLLFKKMPKYWKQIVSISDEEKLISQIQ
jgi:hypothetical protein